jgi:serine protease Do
VVSQAPVGSRIPVDLLRDGKRQRVTVALGERPTEDELAKLSGVEQEEEVSEPPANQQSSGQRAARASLGVTVQTLTPEIARSLRLSDVNVRGVVVASVDPSSDAATKGLRTGDIILGINQSPTRTPEEAAAVVETARRAGRSSVLLLIRRGNNPPLYIGINLAGR